MDFQVYSVMAPSGSTMALPSQNLCLVSNLHGAMAPFGNAIEVPLDDYSFLYITCIRLTFGIWRDIVHFEHKLS